MAEHYRKLSEAEERQRTSVQDMAISPFYWSDLRWRVAPRAYR